VAAYHIESMAAAIGVKMIKNEIKQRRQRRLKNNGGSGGIMYQIAHGSVIASIK